MRDDKTVSSLNISSPCGPRDIGCTRS